jgi:uncharacterized membrane protein
MKQYLITFLTSALALSLFESIWQRVVVPGFYHSQIRETIRPETSLTVAGIFYLLMLGGMLMFSRETNRRAAGCLIGAVIVPSSIAFSLYTAQAHRGGIPLAHLSVYEQTALTMVLQAAVWACLAFMMVRGGEYSAARPDSPLGGHMPSSAFRIAV